MIVAIRIGVYIVFYVLTALIFGPLLAFFGILIGITATGLLASGVANGLTLRIFERMSLPDVGLKWDNISMRNLALGLAGGVGSATLVLLPPVLVGVAHFRAVPNSSVGIGTVLFVTVLLIFGATGEELLFRGYGFQILLRAAGPWATILPVGVVFAAMHAENPHSSYLGLANTAGFGILFGYAFYRSYDLWLPIGLHFGWNFALPIFGVNVSGIKIGVTAYTMEWTAGRLWSGGAYGPEASLLTSAVLFVLFVYLWKAPIRRQTSPLLSTPAGDQSCESGQPQSQ